jgi:hypothetical protein
MSERITLLAAALAIAANLHVCACGHPAPETPPPQSASSHGCGSCHDTEPDASDRANRPETNHETCCCLAKDIRAVCTAESENLVSAERSFPDHDVYHAPGFARTTTEASLYARRFVSSSAGPPGDVPLYVLKRCFRI